MEKLKPLDIGALFHSVLFAYQQGLADVIKTDTTTVVNHYMMPYLDAMSAHTPFGHIETGDVEKTLRTFGDLLVRSELAEDVVVEKTENGFNFKVKGCIFAEHIHPMLNPKDVTCPYGLLAFYLAEKSSGKRIAKTLSEFTLTDSYTQIRFLETAES